MASFTPPNHFDRSKPFYPLVTNYLIQSIGISETIIRAFAGARNQPEALKSVVQQMPLPHDSKTIQATAENLSKLLDGVQLYSEFLQKHIVVSADEIAKEFISNAMYLLSFQMRAAGNLLVLAHEMTKDQSCHDGSPLWEFLRHSRNAAAHGGRFTLRHGEPRRPAQWGRFVIEPALQGTLLFKAPPDNGLLSPGDPIRLLWDIEQAYPNITA